MIQQCQVHNMKPVCDHPSYCRNDASALYIGQAKYIAYHPHRRTNSWFPSGWSGISSNWNGLCSYTANASGNSALCNVPSNTRSWRKPSQYNPGFICGIKAKLPAAASATAAADCRGCKPYSKCYLPSVRALCNDGRFSSLLRANCPRACAVCDPGCSDDSSAFAWEAKRSCSSLATASRLCTAADTAMRSLMKQRCPATCQTCTSSPTASPTKRPTGVPTSPGPTTHRPTSSPTASPTKSAARHDCAGQLSAAPECSPTADKQGLVRNSRTGLLSAAADCLTAVFEVVDGMQATKRRRALRGQRVRGAGPASPGRRSLQGQGSCTSCSQMCLLNGICPAMCEGDGSSMCQACSAGKWSDGGDNVNQGQAGDCRSASPHVT